MEIIEKWHDYIQDGAKVIREKYPIIDSPDLKCLNFVIPRGEAKKVCALERGNGDKELKKTLCKMINKLEYICIAYNSGVLHKGIFHKEIKMAMIFWYDVLKNFIEEECLFLSRTNEIIENPWTQFCETAKKLKVL